MRWNLLAALALVLIVFANWSRRAPTSKNCFRVAVFAFLYLINAFLVHNLLAANPDVSAKYFDLLWKSVGLAFLIRLSLHKTEDLHIFLFAITSLCGYVGYEVVVNEAGTTIAGRLEGIGIANASGANGIAAIMSMGLILCGYFIISPPSSLYRIAAVAMAPLILDTVLRCNSRGAFLGLIASGVWLIVAARSQVRIRAVALLGIGAIAILIQAGDARIWERFFSTFAEGSERDNSAGERLLYWEAALNMVQDYPLGKGAKAAFKSDLGATYIEHFRAGEYRSVHNGFLDNLTSWGVQGFILLSSAFAISYFAMFRVAREYAKENKNEMSFLGAALQSVLIGQLVCTLFTSILDGEWYLWLAAVSLAYATYASQNLEDDSTESEATSSSPRID